jgi:hypothetical protein
MAWEALLSSSGIERPDAAQLVRDPVSGPGECPSAWGASGAAGGSSLQRRVARSGACHHPGVVGTSVDDPACEGQSGAALEGLARAAHLGADYAGTIELYERAYGTYRDEGDLLSAARAARTISWFRGWIYGEWAVANGWMARTRGLLEQAGDDTQERGWVLLADAQAGDDLEQQRRLYLTVIELARRYHDADLECEARNRLGVMLVLSGLVDEGMVALDESLAAACGGDVEDLSVVEGIFCGLFYAL